jgi:hypothetical protein
MASHHLHANGTHSIQPPGTTSHTPHQAIENIANGKPATVPFIADADFVAGTVHHTAHHSQHRHTCKHNPSLLAVLTTTGWPLHAYMQPCTAEFEGSTVHANFPPPHSASNRPSCSRHPQFVTDTIAKYVAQGALFTWGSTQEPPPYITMPLHVAQDPKLRLCYDAGYLNMFTRAMPFRLDTLVDMSATLSPHQPTLLSSFDMKAWYLQHRLHPLSCLLVGIEWHGTLYLYLHPAFGLKLSGYMCDQQPSELCSILRHNMLAIVPQPASTVALPLRTAKYIDDWLLALIAALLPTWHSESAAAQATNALFIAACTLHGMIISMSKSSVTPATSQLWVGFVIDTSDHTFSITDVKLAKVLSRRDDYLSRPLLHMLDIQQWTGTVSSIALMMPGQSARHHTKHANNALSSQLWPIALSPNMRQEAEFFDLLPTLNGKRKWRQQMHASVMPCTQSSHDSSGGMWAFVLHLPNGSTMELQGYWLKRCHNPPLQRCGDEQCEYHWTMHVKECVSLVRGLEQSGTAAHNLFISNLTDSRDFRDAFTIGHHHDLILSRHIQHLWQVLIRANSVLVTEWWNTHDNWHADGITRPTGHDRESMLSAPLFSRILQLHGPFDLDAMASGSTAQHQHGKQLPFISRYYDPAAIHRDIFQYHALPSHSNVYCFPPVPLCGAIVALMLESHVHCTLVLPDKVVDPSTGKHATPSWWPLAAMHAHTVTQLSQPGQHGVTLSYHKGMWKPNKGHRHSLHAFTFSGDGSSAQAAARAVAAASQQEIQPSKRLRLA